MRVLEAGTASSQFNFGTIAAFLTWFGGAGYVLSNWGGLGLLLVLIVAVSVGVGGCGALSLCSPTKVLATRRHTARSRRLPDHRALGTVSSPVLPSGTGEMIFVQQGRRGGSSDSQ